MFMDLEFDYRTFAFIVGQKATQNEGPRTARLLSFAEQLIRKKYIDRLAG